MDPPADAPPDARAPLRNARGRSAIPKRHENDGPRAGSRPRFSVRRTSPAVLVDPCARVARAHLRASSERMTRRRAIPGRNGASTARGRAMAIERVRCIVLAALAGALAAPALAANDETTRA